ncbi:hypothetical protein LCGC14_1572490 [marine sediment metagenome]|uniref:Uncharacterized protein n=1 Tax=marine sediment metagenome TaxID=412755 RepID=A0A0F9IJF1_9ZZZZ
MDLTYQRCPEDAAQVLSATLEIDLGPSGKKIELGIHEIASILMMKGMIYGTTLAIKGGVTEDFVSRVALGLSKQMGDDVHALCPVLGMLSECSALMGGGKAVLSKEGLIDVFPSQQCEEWLKKYFDKKLGD